MTKKNTGSYYTPYYLADFIATRVLPNFSGQQLIRVLEPSVGDGVFVNAIKSNKDVKREAIELTALEINDAELTKAKAAWSGKSASFLNIDFLDYSPKKRFSLIIGNPPYIRKNRLSATQLDKCKALHELENLSEQSVKNIWTAFVVKASRLLEANGVLALILPVDLLQVKFTEEIRDFLKLKYQRLEIFTFNDLMFECKGQDTLILFAYKQATRKGVYYANIESESQLRENKYTLKQNKGLISSKVKWTHHLLTSDEINFIEGLKINLSTVGDYCFSRAGIVTAANDYFVVNSEIEEEYGLSNYTVPIIKKGAYVNGSVVFGESDYNELVDSQLPAKLVVFENKDKNNYPATIKAYLEIGEELGLPNRYKCVKRGKWFVVPNVSKQPEGFFFKRCHLYPKLLKNVANVYVTDSAYRVDMKEGFDIGSLILSFYNSLTLTFAEIGGRYYGGGVLELTPNEFRSLPIPYLQVTSDTFEDYQNEFKNARNIETILQVNDYKILPTVLGLSKEEIAKIQMIRQMLVNKRLKSLDRRTINNK